MIKYENNKGISHIEIEGDLAEIGADIQLLIWNLHKKFFEKDPDLAEMFKAMMKEAMKDEDTFNPDLGKKARKTTERQREDDIDMDVAIELAKILSRINNKEMD